MRMGLAIIIRFLKAFEVQKVMHSEEIVAPEIYTFETTERNLHLSSKNRIDYVP